MILVNKKGRFGNFIFQIFLANYLRKNNHHTIFVFYKNESKYLYNSKKNIDNKITGYIKILYKLSFIKKIVKFFFLEINDTNFKNYLKKKIKSRFIYLDGFFQDYNFVIKNRFLIRKFLKFKKKRKKIFFLFILDICKKKVLIIILFISFSQI